MQISCYSIDLYHVDLGSKYLLEYLLHFDQGYDTQWWKAVVLFVYWICTHYMLTIMEMHMQEKTF